MKFRIGPGFTIVELLIVIVVIAILATISIVVYRGVQNRAYDTTVQSDLRQTFMKAKQFYVLNDAIPAMPGGPGGWPEINQNFVTTRSAYGGGDNFMIYCRTTTDQFAIVGRSKSGNGFAYSTNGGAISFASWPGNSNANLCPAAGIPTTSTGYDGLWIGVNGAWSANYTVGQ